MAERTLGDLIRRVVTAQRNLGPRNPYRLLLAECLSVIKFLGDELVQAKRADAITITRVAEDVAGDSGAGIVADGAPLGPVSVDEGDAHPADAGCESEIGYGAGV